MKNDNENEITEVENGLSLFQSQIVQQVSEEYILCKKKLDDKLVEWRKRLKVYNNQRKKKESVGDPLLFTVFQTIFASLYTDTLTVEFLPREPGDKDVAENLNILAEYDYSLMEKDVLDYEWDWDAMFFGRGFLLNMEFDFDTKTPAPEVISPLSFLRDPRAVSINGNTKGFGSARFFGREVLMTMDQLKSNSSYFNLDRITRDGEDTESLLKREENARKEAQGLQELMKFDESNLKENAYYLILQWFTHIDGKKYLIELANNRTLPIRIKKLREQDYWPIHDRTLFPISHEWESVSIPDLVEDKQRARAVLTNLGLDVAKANANPMYLFDINKIKRRDALDFRFNKFIPVDGDTQTAVAPMRKDLINSEVQWIMDLLDQSAQRALATPEIQQGTPTSEKRTLGELELVSSKVDTRYSLSAKIFGWSEKRFWRQWYRLYKEYFAKDIAEKVARLSGIWGSDFRKLRRDNIVANKDPDVKVESKMLTDIKRNNERQLFMAYLGIAVQDPDFNKREAVKEFGRLSGLPEYKIKQLFPPTIDEIQAEEENKMLERGEVPEVKITDDHQTHLIIHSKLNDSKKVEAHIKTHYEAMRIKKMNIKIFQEMGLERNPQELPVKPNILGKEIPTQKNNLIPRAYGQK